MKKKQDSTETQVEIDNKDTEIKKSDNKENEKPSDTDEMKSRIVQLEAENLELQDKFLRKHADFENFRKRMFKEKEDSIKYANSNLLGDLIPVIDDFERALKSAAESKDFDTFLKGIEMIENQFASMLEKKWGLKRFEADGVDFDPEKHEALMMEESAETTEAKVVEVFQKGYQLNNRVVRHAKVKVSMPLSDTGTDENEIKPDIQA